MMQVQSKPIDIAVSFINEMMEADFILCFGSRIENSLTTSVFNEDQEQSNKAIHFDLLVIIPDDDSCQPDFTGKLENFSDLLFTLTTLIKTRTQVQKELFANNRFFHTVISKAELSYSRTGAKKTGFSGSFYPSADEQKTADFWQKCDGDALEYLRLARASSQAHMIVPLLNKCLEAACRGLLYVMLGYAPEAYSLNQLLNLCDSVDTRFQNIIPLLTTNDFHNFEALMDGVWKGYSGESQEPITGCLYKYCDDFIKLTEHMCGLKLESMKTA